MKQIIDKYSEKIFQELKKEEINKELIIDLFFDMLEEIYALTLRELRSAGHSVRSDAISFDLLVWDKNTDKLEGRILEHINSDNDILDILSKLMILMENEAEYLHNALTYYKLKDYYDYFRIIIKDGEVCCNGCTIRANEIRPIEELESNIPPYHPGCTCKVEYLTEEDIQDEDTYIS